jgi:threonine/homoserine/homoserine lactone efflux protein
MALYTVSLSGIWTLIIASAVLMGSPGPSTMSVTAVGAAFGFRRSLRYVFGLILGTTAVLLAVATGIAAAAYIVFLAVQIARAPPLSRQDSAVTSPSLVGGLLLAIANPKAYVAIAAVFAGATLAGSSPIGEALLKTAVLTLMIVVIHLAWLLAGSSLSRVLSHPVASRIANLFFAGILVITSLFAALH